MLKYCRPSDELPRYAPISVIGRIAIKSPADYDDDYGDGLNANIEQELSEGIPYMIVYSRYSILADDANFSLQIYKD